MKKIPLHSLILLIGSSNSGNSLFSNNFEDYEVIKEENLIYSITGQHHEYTTKDAVRKIISNIVKAKLEIGERAVIDGSLLKERDRIMFTDIALNLNIPIYYLVFNKSLNEKLSNITNEHQKRLIKIDDQIFNENKNAIYNGDGIANVVDMRYEQVDIVKKISILDKNVILNRGFRGIMTVGDIHGMIEPLKNAIDWATKRELFCVFLGDIIDYGPDPLECINRIYDVVTRGNGISMIGNHERKIHTYLNKPYAKLKLSEGNKVTTNIINSMNYDMKHKFIVKFNSLIRLSFNHINCDNLIFAHAAIDPKMFQITDSRLHGELKNLSMYGEIDNMNPRRSDGFPNRIYKWTETIPDGKTAFVGHDIRSKDKPLRVLNEQNGETYFMDTGCGKGGRLTSADILIVNDKFEIKSFKYH